MQRERGDTISSKRDFDCTYENTDNPAEFHDVHLRLRVDVRGLIVYCDERTDHFTVQIDR